MPALPPTARRPRLIASDLDGTIIGYEHSRTGRLSPRTIAALRRAHEAGIVVVFVTGRPLRWLGPLRDQLGEVGPVICSNGAVVVDPGTGEVLHAHPAPLEAVHATARRMRDLDPTATFGAEALEGFFWEAGFSERSPYGSQAQTGATLADVLPDDARVVKLMARSDALDQDALLAAAGRAAEGLLGVTHSAPGLSLVEMAAPGVHKAATLEAFTAELGIAAEDVVAFGDMPNDVEMITWAGTGLAVGSAHEALKAVADGVVGACDEDGVARAIEALLELPGR